MSGENAGLGSVVLPLVLLLLGYVAALGAWVALGAAARRDRAFRATALTVGLALGLLLFEAPALFGSHDYGQTFGTSKSTWLQLSTRVNRIDPDLIHVHWPDSSFQGEVVGNLASLGVPEPKRYPVDVRYDANGFRNDSDLRRADIVVIGDSFVEAAIMPLEAGVAKQLEASTGLVVANLGQSNYGPQQELVVLKRYGMPLEPQLVVWFFFGGNDLRNVDAYEYDREHLHEFSQPRSLRERSFLRNAVKAVAALAASSGGPTSETAIEHSTPFERADGTREQVYFGEGTSPWETHQWEVATGTLREAKRLCDEAGALFVLAYIPRKFRVYRDVIAPGSALDRLVLNDLPDALGRFAAREGIAYVDTTVALKQVVERGEHPYLVDDVHWNAEGHRVAAAAVLERIGGRDGLVLAQRARNAR